MDFTKLYEVDDESLFRRGILIFDTSALLDLYFYSETTALDILDNSYSFFGSARMFLPAQVKFEFDKNRPKTVLKPSDSYSGILDIEHDYGYYPKIIQEVNNFLNSIDKLKEKVNGYVKTFDESFSNENRHPYLSKNIVDKLKSEVEIFYKVLDTISVNDPFAELEMIIQKEINEQQSMLKDRLRDDVVLDKINEYFYIGREYSYSELLQIVNEGGMRYNSKIPPGYMDKDEKHGLQIYGDLIVWKQLLEYAAEHQLPCIFVSNDTKEDWNEFQETNKGKKAKTDPRKPRLELLLEFNDQVGEEFKKLTLKDFVFELNSRLGEKLDPATVEEINLGLLHELILEEKDDFIDSIHSEIDNQVRKDFVRPDDAYDFDIEADDIYISSSSVLLPSELTETIVVYEVEVAVTFELMYWEYWGRDDDTKEVFLSPSGTVSWSGTKVFDIYRNVIVDFGLETIETLSYNIQLVTDDVTCEQETWGDKEDRGLHY